MTEWLSDTLLATSALLLLVLLIRAPVARHFGAGTAYFLWALPAARLFMPTLTQEVSAPAVPVDAAIVETVREAALTTVTANAPVSPVTGMTIDWSVVALSLWLGGAALLFIIQMFRYTAMREELLSDAVEIDQLDGIRVIQTDRIPGPLAFGLFKRYVAVPREFTRTFSPRERELALAHELAHHRGGDLFANLAAFIFLCLMWFNPLAWMAWSAFRFDQEAACDARVVAGADASTRQSYGRALARTATEGLPAFAMALNNPKTIIQRLRRLMMNETSKGRRLTGKLAILAAAIVTLPLTATVVPVFAEDQPALAGSEGEKTVEVRKHKVIVVKNADGKDVTVDVSGDADTPFVKKIEKDGKTIILRSNKELSEADIAKMVAEAEASRAKADWQDADGEKKTAMFVRVTKDGKLADPASPDVMHFTVDEVVVPPMPPVAPGAPEAVRKVQVKCNDGELLTTNVEGMDGDRKTRVKIAMCANAHAKMARTHAIQGLKEARESIKRDANIPESVRKDVMKSLQENIEQLERELKNAPEASGDA
ncbi:M56 family metallopeptidase [Sphingorhabdus sp.]|jgi:beta-lactamase regulating signal transducer with metallopeptidase domain|uniref:M56 family metallopeptidase n=1 Tax=Sphingorhabdus sp. TaxID=1902408 RepID=UPI002CCD23D8|nr:M56 family metallopeptidase [Sphingorhabdus sp.]HMT42434.1 M56 family metallopeptidase [Sphingorhabdus sp.]